jgi:hypothetical protein
MNCSSSIVLQAWVQVLAHCSKPQCSAHTKHMFYCPVVHVLLHRGGAAKAHVVHRIALFDNSGCITQIISQSDIIKWVLFHASV